MILLAAIGTSMAEDPSWDLSIFGTIAPDRDDQVVAGTQIVVFANDDETCGGFAVSELNGSYRIEHLRPGSYSVGVLASGYPGPIFRRLTLDPSQETTQCDFALSTDQTAESPPRLTLGDRSQIAGTVTQTSIGAPVGKVSVVLESPKGDTVAFTLTNQSGTYVLPNIIPGSYAIRIDASDVDSMLIGVHRDVTLKRGKSYTMDFAMRRFDIIDDPHCLIQGFVVDKVTRQLLQGVVVSAWRAEITDTTDSDGRFVLRNVPHGLCELTLSLSGYVTNYQQDLLIPGQAKTVLLALVPISRAKTIGANGGVVQGANGSFLTLPPGALSKNTDISFTLLPSGDYFVGYDASAHTDGFKILPEGMTFRQPVLVTLPLTERLPAGTEIPFSIFHTGSRAFGGPIDARVTDDGRFAVLPITEVDSYGIPIRNCVWVMVQRSNFRLTSSEVRERTSEYCENNLSWERPLEHALGITLLTSVMVASVGEYGINLHYDYNWSRSVTCESGWCRRHYVEATAVAIANGYVEMCVDRNLSPDAGWGNTFLTSQKRVRITRVTYLSGYSQDVVPSSDGVSCASDNDLCTDDICQDGECVHPISQKGIACRSACSDCDPKTGLCMGHKCKACRRCERADAPIYGQCVPECITAADCPEPPDRCYRAVCRSDGCCDRERVGDPPCDE